MLLDSYHICKTLWSWSQSLNSFHHFQKCCLRWKFGQTVENVCTKNDSRGKSLGGFDFRLADQQVSWSGTWRSVFLYQLETIWFNFYSNLFGILWSKFHRPGPSLFLFKLQGLALNLLLPTAGSGSSQVTGTPSTGFQLCPSTSASPLTARLMYLPPIFFQTLWWRLNVVLSHRWSL